MLPSNSGYTATLNGWQFGFGNKILTRPLLQQCYPRVSLFEVRQTHSTLTCQINSLQLPLDYEADCIVSAQKQLLMVIKTADCVPLILIPPDHKQPAALIHAGWRGVINQIVPITLKKYLAPYDLKNYHVWIGPHINQSSFEVDENVAQLFANQSCSDQMYHKPLTNKWHIHLLDIAKKQLQQQGIHPNNIHDQWAHDTLTQPDWYSARRGDTHPTYRNLTWLIHPD